MDDLLDNAPCGFLCFADDRTILLANTTLARWLGAEPQPLQGELLDSILTMGGRIFCQTHLFPLLKLKGQVEEIHLTLKTRAGERLDVLMSAQRVERGGRFVNQCALLPMRQRREYESELLQAKKVADEASQAKARFLSMMSHELRTPMNAILGFGQLLKRGDLPPLQAESIEHILRAGRHLLSLINEVLDLSRIEAGELDLTLKPVTAAEVMAEACEMAQPVALASDISLQLLPGAGDRLQVTADRGRLRQILLNLLANGIKYNRPAGLVTLSCEVVPLAEEASEKLLRFAVQDTGPGIAQEKLSKLFVPFERLGAEAGAVEGTGLGLALCKQLSEAMHGRLGVSTVEGKGSCFWIDLPIASAKDATDDPGAALTESPPTAGRWHETAGSLVLCIEDNASNRALVSGMYAGHPTVRLVCAESGQAGLRAARLHQPDLILLDLLLPDLPGSKVLQQLRADENTSGIPVIVLSADATTESKERLLRAGARAYVAKPFDLVELQVLVDTIIHESRRG